MKAVKQFTDYQKKGKVDIFKILADLNIEVEFKFIHKAAKLGRIRNDHNDELKLGMNTDDPENTRRFYAAHQLGHHLLHSKEKIIMLTGEEADGTNCCKQGERADILEAEAVEFACLLLLPENLIIDAVLEALRRFPYAEDVDVDGFSEVRKSIDDISIISEPCNDFEYPSKSMHKYLKFYKDVRGLLDNKSHFEDDFVATASTSWRSCNSFGVLADILGVEWYHLGGRLEALIFNLEKVCELE